MADSFIHIPKNREAEVIPSFDAVIPAYVRYDSKLSGDAKMLYGEIRALTSAFGFCWATDSYFARLYQVSEKTIKRWLENLQSAGHIVITKERDDETLKLVRIIRISEAVRKPPDEKMDKSVQNFGQICPKKTDKSVRSNNINNNNIKYNRAGARVTQNKTKSKNSFLNYDQRSYDMEALERALLNKSMVGDSS